MLYPQHIVTEARTEGWDQLTNGELLEAAEAAGFDVLVTPDQNIRYQQNLARRRIALVVLSKGQWPYVRNHLAEIAAAVDVARPGSYAGVEILDPNKRKGNT